MTIRSPCRLGVRGDRVDARGRRRRDCGSSTSSAMPQSTAPSPRNQRRRRRNICCASTSRLCSARGTTVPDDHRGHVAARSIAFEREQLVRATRHIRRRCGGDRSRCASARGSSLRSSTRAKTTLVLPASIASSIVLPLARRDERHARRDIAAWTDARSAIAAQPQRAVGRRGRRNCRRSRSSVRCARRAACRAGWARPARRRRMRPMPLVPPAASKRAKHRAARTWAKVIAVDRGSLAASAAVWRSGRSGVRGQIDAEADHHRSRPTRSSRMPASLAPSSIRSFGHLS